MKYGDLYRQIELRERKSEHKNNLIAEKALEHYLKMINEKELPHRITGDFVEDLLYNYFLIKY